MELLSTLERSSNVPIPQCGAVILAHNHPSGIAEPSQADIAITNKLRIALETIDVRVLGHLVIGNSLVVSFAERGLL